MSLSYSWENGIYTTPSALHNAEHKLFQRSSAALQLPPEASTTFTSKIALINLCLAKYFLGLTHLAGINRSAKLIEILVDRIAIYAKQNGGFGGGNVSAKVEMIFLMRSVNNRLYFSMFLDYDGLII